MSMRDFEPKYLIPRDKTKVVKELKDSVQGAREIYLATDPDREGEAIAWHLIHATEASEKPLHRVVFHEITPEAVQAAMDHPRAIDMDLVDAQQARRILDRLVGYGISPLLWKKVKRGLSAGRVQTAALRIVVEREREIDQFVAGRVLVARCRPRQDHRAPANELATRSAPAFTRSRGKKAELTNGEQAHRSSRALDGASWRVADVVRRETQRRPQAPFITSTLQQEASRKLGFAVGRTMSIAQELYEGIDLGAGWHAGPDHLHANRLDQCLELGAAGGPRGNRRRFGDRSSCRTSLPSTRSKSKGAQEAHEAIRPTSPHRDPQSVKKLLSAPAVQALPARLAAVHGQPDGAGHARQHPCRCRRPGSMAELSAATHPYHLPGHRFDREIPGLDGRLPAGSRRRRHRRARSRRAARVAPGEDLNLLKLLPEQHFTQPPPRFTEATLVKALEEQGIGRPSTYAPTIATLQARNYVAVEERKLSRPNGFVVNDLLVEHFPNIFDIGFTSQLEEELDEIASGERAWIPTLHQFYTPFTAR